jgi:hypothetical protein
VSGANPVLDHLLSSYFRPGGAVTLGLASRFVAHSRAPVAVKNRWRSTAAIINISSVEKSQRWYQLRGFVQASVIAAVLITPSMALNLQIPDVFPQVWAILAVTGVVASTVGLFADRVQARRTRKLAIAILASNTRVEDMNLDVHADVVTRSQRRVRAWLVSLLFIVAAGLYNIAWGLGLIFVYRAPGATSLSAAAFALGLQSVFVAGYGCLLVAGFNVWRWLGIPLFFTTTLWVLFVGYCVAIAPAEAKADPSNQLSLLLTIVLGIAFLAFFGPIPRRRARRRRQRSQKLSGRQARTT